MKLATIIAIRIAVADVERWSGAPLPVTAAVEWDVLDVDGI